MASHVTSGSGRLWYHHLTIDLFARVLAKSLLHPFVACIVPLSLRAVQAPYDSFKFLAACGYAAVIFLAWVLGIVNQRVAYGIPREMDWNEEVVVITGGAGGLGKLIAETYDMRGASVAILDVMEPGNESEGLAGVQFYQCDVGDAAAVEKARGQIEKDLGTPTILINNAGIVNGKPMWELSEQEVRRNFDVNLLSHFNTIRCFLPGMLASESGGTIVTLASVLGKLGASHLSDYCAAKAGLIAMHKSLSAELASPSAPDGAENIRTILCTPGQLATRMFVGLETPSSFFGPIVEPVELVREIVRIVDAGEGGELSMPLYTRWVEWMPVLPAGVQRAMRYLSGIDRAMEKVHASRSKKLKM